MTTPLLNKMGIKPDMRAVLVAAPKDVAASIPLPAVATADDVTDDYDVIYVFVTKEDELDAVFPRLKDRLRDGGTLWVSWPKGRALGSDLTIKNVIAVGYSHGLVESKTISVDATWSAIKFTFPRPGKTYHNSYGTLGERQR